MILLIDNYDSFTYNLAQYLGELSQTVTVKRNDAITADQVADIGPSHIVISPGPCTPNEAGISTEVVRKYAGKIPILGVCLGHQSIAQAFGGHIIRADVVMHGKVSKIVHDEKTIFSGIDNPFRATRYHSLIVERESLPEQFEITAKTWNDEIMGIRHRGFVGSKTPLEGVQFHPESISTPAGRSILGNFLNLSSKSSEGESRGH